MLIILLNSGESNIKNDDKKPVKKWIDYVLLTYSHELPCLRLIFQPISRIHATYRGLSSYKFTPMRVYTKIFRNLSFLEGFVHLSHE